MSTRFLQPLFLAFLAIVFTVGLTFVTVELPYRVDALMLKVTTTPDLDSQATDTNRLQTELFIDHYNLRGIGYSIFFLMVALIIAGFSTRKTGLAAVGALAFMLPVFAQFAGVMFFLAGLGVLNVLWMPLLDISFHLQELGKVIHIPYDILMYLGRLAGFNAYWYIVYFFIGSGLLIFLVGTYSWLSAHAGRKKVAGLWIYRLSRHPQYTGWIMWSYGVYLLLLLARYPKRSWGISGSLPWLLSTIFIIGVAMMEELRMLREAGGEYREYRAKAPMLFPMPRLLRRFFSLPLRLMFRKDLPERKREVVAVLTVYTIVLLSISSVFYMGGIGRFTMGLRSDEAIAAEMADIAGRLDVETGRLARYRLADRLRAYGERAEDHFIRLLGSEQKTVRLMAMEELGRLRSEKAVPALIGSLEDPDPDIRSHAVRILGGMGVHEAVEPLVLRLDDPEEHIRLDAMESLASLGATVVLDHAEEFIGSEALWNRARTIDALGILGQATGNGREAGGSTASPAPSSAAARERMIDLILTGLDDESAYVRRRSVIALLRAGTGRACAGLEKARGDEDWEVRVYAAEVSKRLCR